MSFFRAITAATQAMSASTETEVVFGTELSDPDNVFASNRFTVPAGWDGRVGGLSAGFQSSSIETTFTASIQKQTGGTGSFVSIATGAIYNREVFNVAVYPIVFSEGDVYRVVYFGEATTKNALPVNFFSGWAFPEAPTKIGMVRADMSTLAASQAANGWRPVFLDTEVLDSHNVYASNSVTIPAEFDGGFIHLTGGLTFFEDSGYIGIERSTNSGSSWALVAQGRCPNVTGAYTTNIDSGPIAAVEGEMFRLAAYMNASNFNIEVGSWLGAVLFKE